VVLAHLILGVHHFEARPNDPLQPFEKLIHYRETGNHECPLISESRLVSAAAKELGVTAPRFPVGLLTSGRNSKTFCDNQPLNRSPLWGWLMVG